MHTFIWISFAVMFFGPILIIVLYFMRTRNKYYRDYLRADHIQKLKQQ